METASSADHSKGPDQDVTIGGETNLAARLFSRLGDRQLKEIGILSGMLPVIFALCDGQSLSQKALAEYAIIEQPTMANTLMRMEREGLIERRVDLGDRRSHLISLTPVALAKVERVREIIASVNKVAMQNLKEDERILFHGLLKRIIISLQKHAVKEI